MSQVDTRISPALHPDTIKSLDGYNDETKPYVALVETAFSEAYLGVQAVYGAKEAAAKNPTLNDAAKLIQVDAFATKRMDRALKALDAASAKLDQGIAFIEGELSAPVKERAGSSISREIRGHVKAMGVGERQEFIRERIEMRDEDSVCAILGGPAYLSGLNDEMAAVLLRHWHSKQQPAKAARLKVMLAAKDKLERDSGKVLTAFGDAVGYLTEPKSLRKIYASELRKQRDAAEKPFAS